MDASNTQSNEGSITSGENVSFWIDSTPIISCSKPNQDITAEILIIGGGIAGLTTAYKLLKAGKKTVLVEDGFIGSGETGRTTAHLTSALDDRYYFLEKTFGEEATKLIAESHTAAIDEIEKIIKTENIDCSFERVNGYLFLHETDKHENLDKEYQAVQRAGLQTYLLNATPAIANGQNIKCVAFKNQAQFNILQYLNGLTEAIIDLHGIIYTQAHAKNITKKGAKVNGYTFTADNVVVATNSPINNLITMHTKQHAYRTYVIAGKVPKGQLPYCLWWDTGDQDSKWVPQPYHYVRLENYDEKYDLLISGGEDHKTGQEDEEDISQSARYDRLEAWTRTYFPMMDDISYRWSGQIIEPVDSLGFMGKNPGDDNIYIITGDSGNGMTHATIGAMIISDSIMGVQNKWKDLYSPSRITFKTAGDFIKGAGNMALQYLDWLSLSDLKKNTAELPAGEGDVLSSGLKKIAVYRDYDNSLRAFSAVCPHLGCLVHWNRDEKTFDCPCHGSRFASDGTVINGPSERNLHAINIKN